MKKENKYPLFINNGEADALLENTLQVIINNFIKENKLDKKDILYGVERGEKMEWVATFNGPMLVRLDKFIVRTKNKRKRKEFKYYLAV